MADSPADFDPRYLDGIRRFNAGDPFGAHEVWEDLWKACAAEDRRFYQSLIHAAVAIYHAHNGNEKGARRLLGSGGRYAGLYRSPYRGFDHAPFWHEMRAYVEAIITGAEEYPLPQIALMGGESRIPHRTL